MKNQQSIIGHVIAFSLGWALVFWVYYYLPSNFLGSIGRIFAILYIWLWWPMAIFMIWAQIKYTKKHKKDEHEDDQ